MWCHKATRMTHITGMQYCLFNSMDDDRLNVSNALLHDLIALHDSTNGIQLSLQIWKWLFYTVIQFQYLLSIKFESKKTLKAQKWIVRNSAFNCGSILMSFYFHMLFALMHLVMYLVIYWHLILPIYFSSFIRQLEKEASYRNTEKKGIFSIIWSRICYSKHSLNALPCTTQSP